MPLIATPANPVPDGARVEMIQASDAISLRTASWLATSGQGRGTICLLQGRAEYIEKYFETITNLRAKGFAVATLDWRGQGGSQRLLSNPGKGHISHYDRYETDLVALFEQVVRKDCPPPYYALAHSTGGLIVLRFMTRRARYFERAVLTCPFLGLGTSYEPVAIARLLVRVANETGFGRFFIPTGSAKPGDNQPFLGNVLTSDETRYARNAAIIAAAPQLGIGSPTIGWVGASLAAMADIESEGVMEQTKVPLLILSSGNDAIVSNRAIDTIARRLPMARHLTITGARHELLMERDIAREQVLAAIDTFFSDDSAPTR